MLRFWKKVLTVAALLAVTPWAVGFTLLGPGGGEGIVAKLWQLPPANANWRIGYDRPGLDIGAPVQPLEAYRWNVPVITYAYDSTFIRYFGTNGIKAVDAAVRILNELPYMNRMSADLSEFPLNTAGLNYEAAQLGLVDLKTVALALLVEHLGLADSVRWNFAIRERIPIGGTPFGVYSVIKFNYDPVTFQPSSYVNGTLYTYHILEIPPPVQFSDAVEDIPINLATEPVNLPVSSLSSFLILSGYFHTGLTRDDVGGLRYLYLPRNQVAETLLPGIIPAAGTTWLPFLGTNFLGTNGTGTNIITGTNVLATTGLRGGLNKLQFQKVHFDSVLGSGFTSFNQIYRDYAVTTNSRVASQLVSRPVTQPDIVFTVNDIHPGIAERTTTAGWIDNSSLNGVNLIGGPGVITPQVVISFNYQEPVLRNVTPFFITEPTIGDSNSRIFGLLGPTWASFDGSTNAPVIYPAYLNYSIEYLRTIAAGAASP